MLVRSPRFTFGPSASYEGTLCRTSCVRWHRVPSGEMISPKSAKTRHPRRPRGRRTERTLLRTSVPSPAHVAKTIARPQQCNRKTEVASSKPRTTVTSLKTDVEAGDFNRTRTAGCVEAAAPIGTTWACALARITHHASRITRCVTRTCRLQVAGASANLDGPRRPSSSSHLTGPGACVTQCVRLSSPVAEHSSSSS